LSQNLIHTLEGAALGYLLAGTFLFFIVSSLGVVESVSLSRASQGKPVSNGVMVLGIAFAVLLWPMTAKRLCVHRRQTAKMLARILGVRS